LYQAEKQRSALRRGRKPDVLHQLVIDDFIVYPVTNRLLILRELIVLIFHHSIIYIVELGRTADLSIAERSQRFRSITVNRLGSR
jgi:hypothetical protein